MSALQKTTATLRLFGDTLDPDEVSALLGASPSYSARKGDAKASKSEKARIEKTGKWIFKTDDCAPGNLNLQIETLLSKLTQDLDIWRDLASRFQCNLFCGLFMSSSNDGESISANTLLQLGSRGIEIWFDIYNFDEDDS